MVISSSWLPIVYIIFYAIGIKIPTIFALIQYQFSMPRNYRYILIAALVYCNTCNRISTSYGLPIYCGTHVGGKTALTLRTISLRNGYYRFIFCLR